VFGVGSYAAARRFVSVEGYRRREAVRVFGLSRETVLKMCRFSLPPGYPAVNVYARMCRARGSATFVPLAHPPGHCQVDFGEAVGVIGVVRHKLSSAAGLRASAAAQKQATSGAAVSFAGEAPDPIPIGRRVAASAGHARQQRLRRPIIGKLPKRRQTGSPAVSDVPACPKPLLAARARGAVDCGEVPGDQARRRKVSMPICLGIAEPGHALAAGMQDERWGVVAPLTQKCRYGWARVIDPDMYDRRGEQRRGFWRGFRRDRRPPSEAALPLHGPAAAGGVLCEGLPARDGQGVPRRPRGGAPLSLLNDNTTIAVAKICGDGKRERTRAFTELVSHYLFADRFGRSSNDEVGGASSTRSWRCATARSWPGIRVATLRQRSTGYGARLCFICFTLIEWVKQMKL
jgi:hypothetical protein